jgi:hypothetical protein
MCSIHRLRKRCVGEIRDKCNQDREVEVDLTRRDEVWRGRYYGCRIHELFDRTTLA